MSMMWNNNQRNEIAKISETNCHSLISQCKAPFEFLIVAVCMAFDLNNPDEAVRFISSDQSYPIQVEGAQTPYKQALAN